MSGQIYAVMFRINPRNKLSGFPLRYELEIFIDTSLPEGRKISFESPEEDLRRIGFKTCSGTDIGDHANLLQQKYGGFLAMNRDWVQLLVYHDDTLDNAVRLMQEENFTYG